MQTARNNFSDFHLNLLNSRNQWFSKSSSTITLFKTASQFSYPNHLNYVYDNKSFLNLKNLTVHNINREKVIDTLKQREITQEKYNQYHYNTLRTNFRKNSVFITKTHEDNENHQQTHHLTLNIIDNPPKLGLSKCQTHPFETIKSFTQQCNKLSRLAYLSKAQKKTLQNIEEMQKHQKEEIEMEKKTISENYALLHKDIFKSFERYINYLNQIYKKEAKELRRLKEINYRLGTEVQKLSNCINNMKNNINRLASMRLFLICAREAINTDKIDDHFRQQLFKGGYMLKRNKNKNYINRSNPLRNISVFCYFHFALDLLTKNKEVFNHYCKKYHSNVFVFDSVEDFFEKTQFYENKLIEFMKQYEKKKNANEELERTLQGITQTYHSLNKMDNLVYENKERELEKAKFLYKNQERKRSKLNTNKQNRISLQEFRVPHSLSSLTSSQSEKIISAFKYKSLVSKYPMPYSCLLSKLCSIVKNILNSNPKFLSFDETSSFCAFGETELQRIMNKKITVENEDELGDDIIQLLRIVERSFLQLHLLFNHLRKNPTFRETIPKLYANIEKEKKNTSLKQQRIKIETIRRLIVKNVETKTYTVNYKLKKKEDNYKFIKTQSLSSRKKKKSSYLSSIQLDKNKMLHLQDILFY